MLHYTDIVALISHLGFNNIPTTIALEAIGRMIICYKHHFNSKDDAKAIINLSTMSKDRAFSYLSAERECKFTNFLMDYRGEIIREMEKGLFWEDACIEVLSYYDL